MHARVRMWRACCEVGMERGWSDVRVLPEDPKDRRVAEHPAEVGIPLRPSGPEL